MRDPNLPPRPTLLGHDKIIRNTATTIESIQQQLYDQQEEINSLKRKLYTANYRIDMLTNRRG